MRPAPRVIRGEDRSRCRRTLLATVALPLALALTAACAPAGSDAVALRAAGTTEAGDPGAPTGTVAGAAPTSSRVPTVPAPGPLTGGLHRPDLLVASSRTLSPAERRSMASTAGVVSAQPLSLATAPVAGRMVTLAAVDPGAFRRYVPEVSARADAVWLRVAEGDLAIAPELARDLRQELGADLVLGNDAGSLAIRVGARASLPPRVDAVVNPRWGDRLGMVPGNAALVSVGEADAGTVAATLRRRLGPAVTVTPLAETLPASGRQTAFLTGGSVAEAVGSFRYRYRADGTVLPDPAWVAANLRTEPVPILGEVTCHRVMLPQLRAALQEVVDTGLADRIDPGDFGGCYAPRFIDHDPSRGLSLHTWGIAVDLNVQGNLRGTVGEIDRRVVDVFERWGFAWGGDWAYTDPMHFELVALVDPR